MKTLEIIPQLANDMKGHKIDAIEVHPCKVVDGEKDLKIQAVEQCEPKDAEFWSVYVHYVGGGLDCIADCITEKEANGLKDFLMDLVSRFVIDKK